MPCSGTSRAFTLPSRTSRVSSPASTPLATTSMQSSQRPSACISMDPRGAPTSARSSTRYRLSMSVGSCMAISSLGTRVNTRAAASEMQPFAGTTMFASPAVLRAREYNTGVALTAASDLESLVLTVLCMAFPGVMQSAEHLLEQPEPKSFEGLRKHWELVLDPKNWPAAYAARCAAMKCNYKALAKALQQLVPPDEGLLPMLPT
eukprot:m.183006 g.183006  ORF g.183006 m.183006 type:complete len:205 (-) comp9997_c0_seq44:1581-2195(-)